MPVLEAVTSTSAVDTLSWPRSRMADQHPHFSRALRSTDMICSPEVFDQHQVVGRGIQASKENCSTVGRRGQACPNLTEVAGRSRGFTGDKVEILKPCFAPKTVDIVGAIIDQPEIKPDDTVENLDRLAAGSRQAPQGRHDRKRQVV